MLIKNRNYPYSKINPRTAMKMTMHKLKQGEDYLLHGLVSRMPVQTKQELPTQALENAGLQRTKDRKIMTWNTIFSTQTRDIPFSDVLTERISSACKRSQSVNLQREESSGLRPERAPQLPKLSKGKRFRRRGRSLADASSQRISLDVIQSNDGLIQHLKSAFQTSSLVALKKNPHQHLSSESSEITDVAQETQQNSFNDTIPLSPKQKTSLIKGTPILKYSKLKNEDPSSKKPQPGSNNFTSGNKKVKFS